MEAQKTLRKSVDLFNAGEYFESHEVLEALWLKTPKEDHYRNLYKGFIQAAAGLYQIRRGIFDGGARLLESSANYLIQYKGDSLGLNIEKLCRELGSIRKEMESEAGTVNPGLIKAELR